MPTDPGLHSGRATWSEADLRRAITAAGVALWCWNVDSDTLTLDDRGFDLWGLPRRPTVSFADLSAKIHPADRDRVRAAFAATHGITGPYEIDFRVLVDDKVRWISARGQGDEAGIVGRSMFGIFLDVTGRKQAEEGHELLAGEMSHRVKNLLAIASGLTVITSRSAGTTQEMARELTERLGALGRAHDVVRPLPGAQEKAALLGDLLTVLLAPYDDLGAFCGRIRVSVPRMGVGETAATSVALVIHELATNALKYGALSVETGTLDVAATEAEGALIVVWTERGGPPVSTPPENQGYGSVLGRRMASNLGGELDFRWDPEGLVVTLTVSKAVLAT